MNVLDLVASHDSRHYSLVDDLGHRHIIAYLGAMTRPWLLCIDGDDVVNVHVRCTLYAVLRIVYTVQHAGKRQKTVVMTLNGGAAPSALAGWPGQADGMCCVALASTRLPILISNVEY